MCRPSPAMNCDRLWRHQKKTREIFNIAKCDLKAESQPTQKVLLRPFLEPCALPIPDRCSLPSSRSSLSKRRRLGDLSADQRAQIWSFSKKPSDDCTSSQLPRQVCARPRAQHAKSLQVMSELTSLCPLPLPFVATAEGDRTAMAIPVSSIRPRSGRYPRYSLVRRRGIPLELLPDNGCAP
jgi:hypothetical protein